MYANPAASAFANRSSQSTLPYFARCLLRQQSRPGCGAKYLGSGCGRRLGSDRSGDRSARCARDAPQRQSLPPHQPGPSSPKPDMASAAASNLPGFWQNALHCTESLRKRTPKLGPTGIAASTWATACDTQWVPGCQGAAAWICRQRSNVGLPLGHALGPNSIIGHAIAVPGTVRSAQPYCEPLPMPVATGYFSLCRTERCNQINTKLLSTHVRVNLEPSPVHCVLRSLFSLR